MDELPEEVLTYLTKEFLGKDYEFVWCAAYPRFYRIWKASRSRAAEAEARRPGGGFRTNVLRLLSDAAEFVKGIERVTVPDYGGVRPHVVGDTVPFENMLLWVLDSSSHGQQHGPTSGGRRTALPAAAAEERGGGVAVRFRDIWTSAVTGKRGDVDAYVKVVMLMALCGENGVLPQQRTVIQWNEDADEDEVAAGAPDRGFAGDGRGGRGRAAGAGAGAVTPRGVAEYVALLHFIAKHDILTTSILYKDTAHCEEARRRATARATARATRHEPARRHAASARPATLH